MPHPVGEGIEMTAEAWIALGALIFTVMASAVTSVVFLVGNKNAILKQMSDDKESIDAELMAIRMSAYEEDKTLRKEIGEGTSIARVEFGETVTAIREKIREVELWTRDQLAETRHTLTGSMDMRHSINQEKMEKIDEKVRQLELFNARQGYEPED